MTDKVLFSEVFENFQARYSGLEMKGTFVYYNGECILNTDGYSLLWNLKRLCDALADELV